MLRRTVFFLMLLLVTPAFAQAGKTPALPASGDKPVEISAATSLEWNRKDKKYIARGDAQIQQGEFLLKAARIEALYRATPQTESEIFRIVASDRVEIHLPPQVALGDEATYDVDTAQTVLTGKDLKIVTPQETITARDRIVYDQARQTLSAQGTARVEKGEDVLTADRLTAFFTTAKDGSQALDRIEAEGSVVITTPREKVTGRQGVYTAATQKALLEGPVRIESAEGFLDGARAEVDMTPGGTSRLFAPQGGPDGAPGRVTGRFYPKKKSESPAPLKKP